MTQFTLALDPPPPVPPLRRIDITLGLVADIHEAMSDDERATIEGTRTFGILLIVARLRSMERAEEEVRGHAAGRTLAAVYDDIIAPGDNPAEALVKTFFALYGTAEGA